MSVTLEKSQTSEPQATAARFRDRLRKRLFADRAASKIVVLGGLAIIFSILAIFLVIFAEVWPLFRSAQVEKAGLVDSPAAGTSTRALGLGSDEYREIIYRIEEGGEIRFLAANSSKGPLRVDRAPDLGDAKFTCAVPSLEGYHAVGTSDGRVIPFQVVFETKFEGGKRTQFPDVRWESAFSVDDTQRRKLRALAFAVPKGKGQTAAALLSDEEIALHAVQEGKGLLSGGEKVHSQVSLRLPAGTQASSVLLDNRAEDLFVGTVDGRILHYEIPDEGNPVYGGAILASSGPGVAISSMAFLLGDRTLIVGDAAGAVSSWQIEQYGGQERRIQRVYRFASHRQAVCAIAPSWRDKGFLTADASGEIVLHYGTTGETVARAQGPATLSALYFAPKSDGFFAIDEKGGVSRWELDNPHPETTVQSLFGKIRYEGYQEPEYVWQSTGGTDDFEAKFSLVPLIFGTLKGTFYALLFAVPIALLAALYTSQFMHPRIRAYVKPTVEIMAALPSVVLGFLAGLWIAPQIEKIVPGIFLFPVVLPITILAGLGLWKLTPQSFRGRLPAGAEISLLIPVVLLGSWLAFSVGSALENGAMQGDYRHWLLETMGLTYDQRNSMVVGFAMGFAVIPIIFTIAEDSLSNVPQHLTAGSLALGATRWQTALRIVLPTGSPGIFSAIMIGFGRAVGETMIVLMATGNTPVMDLSIFSGFRALSANIAVELPEAPEGGTLYRVLFLAALLLFVLTFAVNTVAEIVRLRLRNKYRYL